MSSSQKVLANEFRITHNHYGLTEVPLSMVAKEIDSDYDGESDSEEEEELDPEISAVFSVDDEGHKLQKTAEKLKAKAAGKKETMVHKESIMKHEMMDNKHQILSVEQNEQAAA